MPAKPFNCGKCGRGLPEDTAALAALSSCPGCGTGLRVRVFPALRRQATHGGGGRAVAGEGEAVCAFHPGSRASSCCDECGRLICALCDLEVDARHYCPGCLEKGRQRGSIEVIERRRKRYDQMVFSLLLLPLLTCGFLLPVSSVAALGVIGWGWRSPPSRLVRTRLRLGVCVPIALAEFAGGVVFWAMVFRT